MAKYIHSIAQIREKADKEKVKISASYETSAFSGLPSKYTKPTGKDHLELFICEGDSAKSPIVKCRDTAKQGKINAPYHSNMVCVNFWIAGKCTKVLKLQHNLKW